MGGADRAPAPAGLAMLRHFGRPLVRLLPFGEVALGLVARVAIAFLQLTQELIFVTRDSVPVVVGEFAPLLFHLSFHLFPLTLYRVPVHFDTSNCLKSIHRASGRRRTFSGRGWPRH